MPELATAPQSAEERISAQRRALPDAPGVYLFRDSKRRVLYVGKAKSLRKRVASHFSNPSTKGARGLLDEIANIEFIATTTEAEALLAEQNFIRQYRPRYNVRLRDDKSYPYIAISLDEDFPRVYFTRERHRRGRAYFGPFSNAKRVRETLDLLGKVFQYRTCDGAEPGRASGSPCLDYFIKRCQAPCVGYISKEEYRASVQSIVDFLSGRYRQIERDLEQAMHAAAQEQEFEQAALYRNRLSAVRSLLERQRISNAAVGTLDAIAVAGEETDANAQVFQVRDGVLADRQSFYLDNAAARGRGGGRRGVRRPVLRDLAGDPAAGDRRARASRTWRRSRRPSASAAARRSRCAMPSAATSAASTSSRSATRGSRSTRTGCAPSGGECSGSRRSRCCSGSSAMETIPMRVECFDISNLGETHTVASMVVFEGAAPKKSDYRRFAIREAAQDDFAAMEEVLTRRMAQYVAQRERSPHERSYDASFASLPALIVIDGGKGQLSSGLRPLKPFTDLGVTVVSLAKRIEEVFLPGRSAPIVMAHDSPALQLLQRVRDEAHRFAIEFHRGRSATRR